VGDAENMLAISHGGTKGDILFLGFSGLSLLRLKDYRKQHISESDGGEIKPYSGNFTVRRKKSDRSVMEGKLYSVDVILTQFMQVL
jgi:hypothetical protein